MTTGGKIRIAAGAFVGLLVVALVGWHYYLRWSAARYRSELIRKGERLEIGQVLPKARLSEENGVPGLMGAIAQFPNYQAGVIFLDNPVMAMHLLAPGEAVIGCRQPDLRRRGGDKTNSWEELRSELGLLEPAFEEIRIALKKPSFDFNVNYSQGFSTPLPHLARMKTGARALSSSALLHLHDQRLDLALRDLQAELALARVMENEEFVISQLVRLAIAGIAVQATWEALQAPDWTDVQLAELQSAWQALPFLVPFGQSLLMERAVALDTLQRIRESDAAYQSYIGQMSAGGMSAPPGDPMEAIENSAKSALGAIGIFIWRNFSSYSDERRYLAVQQVAIEASRQRPERRICTVEQKQIKETLARLGFREVRSEDEYLAGMVPGLFIYNLLAVISMNSSTRAFTAETQRELVVAAIALKRYQLRHGHPPPRLETLAGEFVSQLPRDYMDGKPLRYGPREGGFVLYSVGLDGIDNGGDPSPTNRPAGADFRGNWLLGRDWVWPQPASREAVEKYNRTLGEEIGKRFKPGREKKQSSTGQNGL